MVANICPNNPKLLSTHDASTFMSLQYREALINDTFRRSGIHRILWRAATMASVYPRSFVKVVWNFRKRSPDFLVVDLRHVWFDLAAERWEDIRYLIKSRSSPGRISMPVSRAKETRVTVPTIQKSRRRLSLVPIQVAARRERSVPYERLFQRGVRVGHGL